jgi:tRNA(fMet)-specific endonuclease VapC
VTYLLDTNACIQAVNRSPGRIVERLRAHSPRAIRLSVVTKAELLYGARHSQRVTENLQLLAAFWHPFLCLPFDDPCAEQYAIIRADLASRGQLIGHADLMIAATARAHDLTLVTHNLRDFSRVVGLRLEDWEADPERS